MVNTNEENHSVAGKQILYKFVLNLLWSLCYRWVPLCLLVMYTSGFSNLIYDFPVSAFFSFSLSSCYILTSDKLCRITAISSLSFTPWRILQFAALLLLLYCHYCKFYFVIFSKTNKQKTLSSPFVLHESGSTKNDSFKMKTAENEPWK